MTASALPPGVVVAPRAGACARCGAAYPAGAHTRGYANGHRPTACGCHPVEDRVQTAPTQPEELGVEVTIGLDTTRFEIGVLTAARDVLQLELNAERRRVVSLQGQADARAHDLAQARRAQAEADRVRAHLHARVAAAAGLTREQAHVVSDDELVLLVEHLAAGGRLGHDLGGTPSDAVSPGGGAPAAATPTVTSPSASTPPARASAPSSPATPAAAASPPTSRSSAPPDRPANDRAVVNDYRTGVTSHICSEPGCAHRQRAHDEDGCTVRRCSCTRFTPR